MKNKLIFGGLILFGVLLSSCSDWRYFYRQQKSINYSINHNQNDMDLAQKQAKEKP